MRAERARTLPMNPRRRPNMRRLVDNTVALVHSGALSAELAANKLHENGVPLAVIGRVLGAAVLDRSTGTADGTVSVPGLRSDHNVVSV